MSLIISSMKMIGRTSFTRISLPQQLGGISVRFAAGAPTKKGGGGGGKAGGKIKKILDVETDPVKLVNFCCGLNYKNTGEEIALKPDSEYPEWLFTMPVKRPKPLAREMENKNSIEYWLLSY